MKIADEINMKDEGKKAGKNEGTVMWARIPSER